MYVAIRRICVMIVAKLPHQVCGSLPFIAHVHECDVFRRLASISLSANALNGTLSSRWSLLQQLSYLDLSKNQITGASVQLTNLKHAVSHEASILTSVYEFHEPWETCRQSARSLG